MTTTKPTTDCPITATTDEYLTEWWEERAAIIEYSNDMRDRTTDPAERRKQAETMADSCAIDTFGKLPEKRKVK